MKQNHGNLDVEVTYFTKEISLKAMRNAVEWLGNEKIEVGPWKKGWSLCKWANLPSGTVSHLWHWNKILKPKVQAGVTEKHPGF